VDADEASFKALIPLELTRFECLPTHLLDEIYETEGEGLIIENMFSVTVRRAKLLRRIEAWNRRTARLFAADCAEHVLPIYDSQLWRSASLRAIIRTCRDHAEGWIDSYSLKQAWREADDILSEAVFDELGKTAGTGAVAAAVKACAASTIYETALAVTFALDAAGQFAKRGMPDGEAETNAGRDAFFDELAWQAQKLAEYLYPPPERKP
jgi:hypothetical protein